MAKVGRPTDYHDEMPILLYYAMSEGKSVTRFCRDVSIGRNTFYQWLDRHKEFKDAFDHSEVRCEAFWEDWLVNNFENKNVNSALIKMFFTNRFKWADKSKEE